MQHLRVPVRLCFDLMRGSASDNPAVLRRLLRALALVASQVKDPSRPTDYERRQVQVVYDHLCAAWA
jgi:uncharacterized membrane protein